MKEDLIKSPLENKIAIVFISRLMDGDPESDSEQGKFLLYLSKHVKIYEDKMYGKI